MDLNIQPLGAASLLTGKPFTEGERVTSYLISAATGELVRNDVLESEAGGFTPEGVVVCRWTRVFKLRVREGEAERNLKMSADNLFQTLADPTVEASPETGRLVRFLALMLERKRVLKPRGHSADGSKLLYEHSGTKQTYEIEPVELTAEFFDSVRGQLGALLGEPKGAAASAPDGNSAAG